MGCDCGCGGDPNCPCQRGEGAAMAERFQIIMETAAQEGLLPPENKPTEQAKKGEALPPEKKPSE